MLIFALFYIKTYNFPFSVLGRQSRQVATVQPGKIQMKKIDRNTKVKSKIISYLDSGKEKHKLQKRDNCIKSHRHVAHTLLL